MNMRIRKALEDNEEGFTLIELLVVMIIIGILAAIAIPTFLNQRTNGYNAAVKTDLSNLALAIESAAVDQNGDITKVITTVATGTSLEANGATVAASFIAGFDFRGTTGVSAQVNTVSAVTAGSYCIVGNNASGGSWWTYSKAKGGLQTASAATAAAASANC